MSKPYPYETSQQGTNSTLVVDDKPYSSVAIKRMVEDMGYMYARITGLTPDGQALISPSKHKHTGAASTDGAPLLGVVALAQPPVFDTPRLHWDGNSSGTYLTDDHVVNGGTTVANAGAAHFKIYIPAGVNRLKIRAHLNVAGGLASFKFYNKTDATESILPSITTTAHTWFEFPDLCTVTPDTTVECFFLVLEAAGVGFDQHIDGYCITYDTTLS